MSLFGKKKEEKDKVLDEIRKAVDGVNTSQQSNESQQPQNPETKPDIIEEMEKKFEQRQHDQRQFENRQSENRQIEEKQPEQKREEVRQDVRQEVNQVKQPERPAFAPLFVKLDRYRQILNAIGYLKATMIMIKNSLMTLNELDNAREETFKIIQDAVGKLEGRLSTLDQELIRPSGYNEIIENPEYHDVGTVEATVADLKGQIEQLRSELQSMT